MIFYTVGYGPHTPTAFVALLQEHGVRTVVDVRIWPIRAAMGSFVMAKDPDRGIAGLLGAAGIGYRWWAPLGNPWFTLPDDEWRAPYRELLQRAGPLVTDGLADVPAPWALVCSEGDHRLCHRALVADYLVETWAWEAIHLR